MKHSPIPAPFIVESLKKEFGRDLLDAYESYGMPTVVVSRERILEVLRFLKHTETLNFHFLTDLTGVHYPTNVRQEMGVIYHLHNMPANTRLRVTTFFPEDDARVASATELWAGANWMERETYDFFGIVFEGHPDLRRILNVEDLGMFPMLKYYPLEDSTRTDKNDKMFGR